MSSRETSKQPPQLEALPDQELAKATRALWPKLRDATATTFAAFLGEAHVFSLLRRAGVAFLRGIIRT